MKGSVEERRRRERRAWGMGLGVSLLLHLLVFLFFQSEAFQSFRTAAAGPRAGNPKAAAGGGGLTALVLRPAEPIVVPPRPERVLEPEPVETQPQLETVPSFSETRLARAGEGREEGPETGPGLPGGEGEGDAGDDAEGLRRLIEPDPWQVLMPFGAPPEARGREVTLHVFVTAIGTVDSVRLEGPTPSREYNERLVREAYEWTFKPALRGGRPVAAWYRYSVTISH